MGERRELLCDVWIDGVPRESEAIEFAKSVQKTIALLIPDQIRAPDTISVKIEFFMQEVLSCDIEPMCSYLKCLVSRTPLHHS